MKIVDVTVALTTMRRIAVRLAFFYMLCNGAYGATLTEFPQNLELYPRNTTTNMATVPVKGAALESESEISLKVYRNDVLWDTFAYTVTTDLNFSFDVQIPAELANYQFELSATDSDGVQTSISTANNIVAGDVFVINGQSNAVSANYSSSNNNDANVYVRTFGGWGVDSWQNNQQWHIVQSDCTHNPGCTGQLGHRLGRNIVTAEQIPVAIINGARGGVPISYFQRDDENPENLTNNYGRLLTKLTQADLLDSIRAIVWYQGESDGIDFNSHINGFTQLHADWSESYPSVERIYGFQIRNGCGPQLSETSHAQREFARQTDNVIAVSTTGLDGHDGCHYSYTEGYRKMGDNLARIIRGDLYDTSLKNSDAPDLISATLLNSTTIELTFTVDNDLVADNGFGSLFELRNTASNQFMGISNAIVRQGSSVQLTTTQSIVPNTELDITYLSPAGNQNWLTNAEGIGIQTFFRVPITLAAETNVAPELAVSGAQFNTIGDVINLPVNASDTDGDTLVVSVSGLPAGLEYNDETATVEGVAFDTGIFDVNIEVDDGRFSAVDSFTWTVLEENLALNKPVTASSWAGQPTNQMWHPDNLTDGGLSFAHSSWASNAWSFPQWATIDLGTVRTIAAMTIQAEYGQDNRNIKDYVLYGSNTGAFNGEELILSEGEVPSLARRGQHLITFEPASARYVRIQGNSSHSQYVIIGELSLFGPSRNIAINGSVTASSWQDQPDGRTWHPDNLIDGNVSNGQRAWASATGDFPQWATIDLGSPQTFGHMVIQGEYGLSYRNINQYKLYGSDTDAFDGEQTLISEGSIPPLAEGHSFSVGFTPATARYVQIVGESSHSNSSQIIIGDLALIATDPVEPDTTNGGNPLPTNTMSNLANGLSVDGDLNDWVMLNSFGVDPDDVDSNLDPLDWREGWIANDAQYFYIAHRNDGVVNPSWGQSIYLDTDGNTSTGFNDRLPIGADYLVQAQYLYRYSGDGNSWQWTYVTTMAAAFSDTASEYRVAGADLGNPALLHIAFVGSNEAYPGGTVEDLYPDGFYDANATTRFFHYQPVVAGNSAPVAQRQSVVTTSGESLPIALEASDFDGDFLTYLVGSTPLHGTLEGNAPDLVYVPEPAFTGTDEFTFQVDDGELSSGVARVQITVQSANDRTNPSNMTQNLIMDGSLDDWSTLQSFGADDNDINGIENPIDLLEVWMAHDSSNLYVAYQNDTGDLTQIADWGFNLFMDTDKNVATGFSDGHAIGSEYLLQGDSLYRYSGNGMDWAWTYISSVQRVAFSNNAEVAISRAALGDPTEIDIIFLGDNPALDGSVEDQYPDGIYDANNAVRYYSYSVGGSVLSGTDDSQTTNDSNPDIAAALGSIAAKENAHPIPRASDTRPNESGGSIGLWLLLVITGLIFHKWKSSTTSAALFVG